jgi:hypothetical protein
MLIQFIFKYLKRGLFKSRLDRVNFSFNVNVLNICDQVDECRRSEINRNSSDIRLDMTTIAARY